MSAKFSSALSSHNTASKFKLNHFAHRAFPSHTRQPEFDPQPRLISVPLVTTHPSRTSHDFKVCRGTQPSLHGKGQKKCMEVANGANPTFPGRAGICMLSNYCITQDNVIPPVQIRAELKTKLFSKRPNFTNTFFLFFFLRESKCFSLLETGEEDTVAQSSSTTWQIESNEAAHWPSLYC